MSSCYLVQPLLSICKIIRIYGRTNFIQFERRSVQISWHFTQPGYFKYTHNSWTLIRLVYMTAYFLKFKVQETPTVNVNELQPSESPASVSASKGKGRGRKRIQPSAAELEACDENAF